MKRCPQCHSEFADQVIHCVKDGQPLEPAGGADTPSPVAGKPRPLAELLASETPMAVARAARMAIALCATVAEQRRTDGSDRAIDPQTIFIDESAADAPPLIQIKADASPTTGNAPESNAPYLAPETSPQTQASAAADVYSIGAIAYHLFTGEPPFAAASAAALRVKQLLEKPRPLIDLRSDLPPRLDAAIRRALEKEPAARPASLAQLQSEITSALSDTNTPAPIPIPQATSAFGGPPLASVPVPPPPPNPAMPAPQMAMSGAAVPPAAAAPLAAAGKRKIIAAVLGLFAVLSAAAALAVFFMQSKSAVSVQTSIPRAVNENASSGNGTPPPVNQNTPAQANSNASAPPKKAQPAPVSPAPRTQPAPKNKPTTEPKAAPPTEPPIKPDATPNATPTTPAPPNQPPSTAPPRPAARIKPPIGNVTPLAPMPDVGGTPTPANNNTAPKTQPRARPKAQPRPAQPVAATPPPQATPAPPATPAPLTAVGEVVMVSRTRQIQWLIPSLLVGLALVTGIVAGLFLQSYRLKRHTAQTAAAAALAQAPQAVAAQAAKIDEARTTPASAGETQANAPALETKPVLQGSATTIIANTTLPRDVLHRCPACQKEYPLSVRFCVHDGTTLAEASKSLPPKDEPSFYDLQTLESRKHCPQCGTEYPLSKKFCRYDGGQLVDRRPPAPPPADALRMSPIVIGQYRCFARLGEGGMGIVYKAQHVHLKRLSAIKVLLPQTAILPDAVQMFRHEAQLASSINHPNSVIIYDYGELDASLFYLAMEFIAGASLAEIIAPDGITRPVSLARTLDITQQVCDALAAAHQLGIIHRDLKPHNVMVTMHVKGGDFVKVVDFGIARSLKMAADYTSLPGAIVGTPAYMSPEQARGVADLDARSDIYSLGVMVYQMLSGAMPFPAKGLSTWQQIDRRATLHELPPPLNDLRPDLRVPQAVNKAVMRALDPDRARRFTTASDFMHDLSQAARSAT